VRFNLTDLPERMMFVYQIAAGMCLIGELCAQVGVLEIFDFIICISYSLFCLIKYVGLATRFKQKEKREKIIVLTFIIFCSQTEFKGESLIMCF
jgi:hypothetical protein